MNDQNLRSTVPRHPLFRAMVLMGNGIAVGCGGTTVTGRTDLGDGTGGAGGSPVGSGGLTGASGGSVSFGGSGGAMIIRGTGGTELIALGGATNDLPPLQLPCVPAQYDCPSANATCNYVGRAWSFDAACTCNPKRPRSRADCATGESFVCLEGSATAEGRPLEASGPFECSCVPGSFSYCGEGCDTAFQGVSAVRFSCSTPTAGSILCGCAVVTLK